MEVKASLIGLLVFFSLVVAIEDSNLLFEFFELFIYLVQDLLQLFLLSLSLRNRFCHPSDLLVELGCSSDLLEHLEEASFAFVNQLLYLALFDDLVLRKIGEGQVAALEEVDQILLGDRVSVDLVVLAVRIAVVGLANREVLSVVWNSMLRIVKCYFDPEGVDLINLGRALSSSTLLRLLGWS